MPAHPLSDKLAQQAIDAWARYGRSRIRAAEKLGLPEKTFEWRLAIAQSRRLKPRFQIDPPKKSPKQAPEKARVRVKAPSQKISLAPSEMADAVLGMLRHRSHTLEELTSITGGNKLAVRIALDVLKANGVRLEESDGKWSISRTPMQSAFTEGPLQAFFSETDGTFTFGACGDQHLCSKYERLDVLDALYDAYAEAGCKVVFNTGNWIDGEAKFNKHDLHTHGLDAQVQYLARVYPQRDGITTYAVAGDDHEGWYAQREGVDIGRYAERAFLDSGRRDWVNLGFMEAPVKLLHALTGKEAIISVVHPGGGSAYALSYAIQKIIESLDGGEKPAVGLYGHYHKLWTGNIRNVWCVQTGCSQDQTPFQRKKKIEAQVGGALVRLTQDPATGAIVRCQVELMRFFNKGYYAGRWSHHGEVVQLPRLP